MCSRTMKRVLFTVDVIVTDGTPLSTGVEASTAASIMPPPCESTGVPAGELHDPAATTRSVAALMRMGYFTLTSSAGDAIPFAITCMFASPVSSVAPMSTCVLPVAVSETEKFVPSCVRAY